MDFNLETVRDKVIECTKCDLCKTRTNAVPGKGSFNSDVMIIGEAPGRNEDLQGEPFVGIAGKKLSLALENAGISREEIYITNTVIIPDIRWLPTFLTNLFPSNPLATVTVSRA